MDEPSTGVAVQVASQHEEVVMRIIGVTLLFAAALPLPATADNVTVPNQFVSGTTIKASEMNANFDTLAAESNENDMRVSAAESDIEALSASVNGRSLTWLGYTSQPFVVNGSISASPISLNNFCKEQFNDEAAEVANLDSLLAVSRTQTIAAPVSTVVFLPVVDSLTALMYGQSSTSYSRGISRYWNLEIQQGNLCTLGTTFAVGCSMSGGSIENPLACVKATP